MGGLDRDGNWHDGVARLAGGGDLEEDSARRTYITRGLGWIRIPALAGSEPFWIGSWQLGRTR